MRDVLISIQPQWVEKIENGEKTIEVRKTKPKLETPFKCYIYETYDKKYDDIGVCWEKGNTFEHACKKVIGEFICDKIIKWECKNRLELDGEWGLQRWRRSYMCFVDDLKKTCLTYTDLGNYGKGETLYGWHISDLKIYDKPKELREFTPVCKYKGERCDICCFNVEQFGGCHPTLSRPPQSWCYVEGWND